MLHHALTKTICLSPTNATETNTVSGTLTNGGTGYVEIDTLGYDYAALDIALECSNRGDCRRFGYHRHVELYHDHSLQRRHGDGH